MTAVDCIMAVDSGLSGAIAFYFPSAPERVSVDDVPVVDGVINGVALAQRVEQFNPTFAIVEIASARPHQGVTSMFSFGRAFGTVIGVIQSQRIPVEFVSAAKWKKHFRVGADKGESRRRAIELFPAVADRFERVKDHGRAEAALLARYAAEVVLAHRRTA